LRCEDIKTSAARAEIDLPIGNHWRSPCLSFDLRGPIRFACPGIQTVKRAPAVGDKHKTIVNRRRGHDMLLQWIRPDQAVGRDVAGLCRVNTFQPCLVLAPEYVATPGHINAVSVKDGHAVKITRPF